MYIPELYNQNFREPNYLLGYLDRGLLTIHEWDRLRNLELFSQAWRAGGFFTVAKQEVTKKLASCSICHNVANPGLLKFWVYFGNFSCFCHFHPSCFHKIIGGSYES